MSTREVALILTKLLAAYIFLAMSASGQELKSIKECRGYRDAWMTSTTGDLQRLTVKELLHRADQMTTCPREIDTRPIEEGMTEEDAFRAAVSSLGYAVLASSYYREAFNRAEWFIQSKHLTSEFIAADEAGKIKASNDETGKKVLPSLN